MYVWDWMLNLNSQCHAIIIENTGGEFSSIVHTNWFNSMFGIIGFQPNKLRHYFGKSMVVCRQKRDMWDQHVDVSINTMKYLNGPDNGWIGPQISPWILSRNFSGSTWILKYDGLKSNFPVAQAVQPKSLSWENLIFSISWPIELPIIFHIILFQGAQVDHANFGMYRCFEGPFAKLPLFWSPTTWLTLFFNFACLSLFLVFQLHGCPLF